MSREIDKIKGYWLKLVPEAKNELELRKLVEKSSNIDIDCLAENLYGKNRNDNNDDYWRILNEKKHPQMNDFVCEFSEKITFFHFYEPFINKNIIKWFKCMENIDIIDDINLFMKKVIISIINKLANYASRTLILEINIARIENKLKGCTDKERFEYFNLTLLCDKQYVYSLYKKYNELIKILIEKSDKYFEYIYEILINIKKNLIDISKTYNINQNYLKIISIDTGMGDEHSSGRSVSIVKFINGFKLVYKPRNLKIDQVFQNTLEWVEKRGKENVLPIKKLKVFNKNTFGLVDYVENEKCNSIEEVKEFYVKMGQVIAILYSLNSVDFHCENIIASASNPVLIDLETLFHPYVKIHVDELETESQRIANDFIDNSVQSIGILPHFIMDESRSDEMIDISGLGGSVNQKSPFKSYVVKNINTDHIEVARESLELLPDKNNPVLNGKLQNSSEFLTQLITGFEACYNVILKNKKEYIDWISQNYNDCENRIIFRPTRDYTQLLNTSYHPDLLQDREDRIVFMSRIFSSISEKENKVVEMEFNSLMNANVPYFKSNISSRNICDLNGNIYEYYLDEAPLKTVCNRIEKFSKEDLYLQIKYIKISYETKNSNSEKDITSINFSEVKGNSSNIDTRKYIELAKKIGDYVVENSIKDNCKNVSRTWVSAILSGRNEVGVGIQPIGDDLYNGNSGVAVYLTYLGYMLNEYTYIEKASEALESRRKFIDNVPEKYPFSIGAFNGFAGTIYAFDKLITYGKRSQDKIYIEKYLKYLNNIVFLDEQYDLIGGAVGCIAVLLSIIRTNRYPELNDLIQDIINKCCTHLLNKKQPMDIGGISWGNIINATGFVHGNAGVITYLSQLLNEGWVENREKLSKIVDEALEFERKLYVPSEKNWFKDIKRDQVCYGWCHGAPGILLEKCLIKKYREDDYRWNEEIEIALNTTIKKGFGNNPTLCHGDLGNLEILYIASEILKDDKLKNQCEIVFDKIYEDVISKRWKGKSFRGVDSYSIMIGLCGFGYSLLRFSKLKNIPSILCLE